MEKQRIVSSTPVRPFSIFDSSPAPTDTGPKRYADTPHAKLSGCQTGVDYDRHLTDQEIRALNTYDFMAHLGKSVINPGGVKGRDEILALLKPTPASRILEIGCGTGSAARYLAKHYGCHVTAIDISPRMIRDAQAVVQTQGLENLVSCEVGDITTLPFNDSTFDYVICQAVLMFVDKRQALAEIQRVLRPGGRFAGLEFSWKCEPSEIVRQATYTICGCRTLEFHSWREWAAHFDQAGFERVESREQPFTMLSLPGFVRDEGLANSLRIFGKVLRRRANIQRMSEIWRHFSRHADYFSYTVLSANRLS